MQARGAELAVPGPKKQSLRGTPPLGAACQEVEGLPEDDLPAPRVRHPEIQESPGIGDAEPVEDMAQLQDGPTGVLGRRKLAQSCRGRSRHQAMP